MRFCESNNANKDSTLQTHLMSKEGAPLCGTKNKHGWYEVQVSPPVLDGDRKRMKEVVTCQRCLNL